MEQVDLLCRDVPDCATEQVVDRRIAVNITAVSRPSIATSNLMPHVKG